MNRPRNQIVEIVDRFLHSIGFQKESRHYVRQLPELWQFAMLTPGKLTSWYSLQMWIQIVRPTDQEQPTLHSIPDITFWEDGILKNRKKTWIRLLDKKEQIDDDTRSIELSALLDESFGLFARTMVSYDSCREQVLLDPDRRLVPIFVSDVGRAAFER